MPKVAPAPFLVGWRSRIQYKHHFRRYYLKQWEFYSFAVQTNQTLADSSNEFVIMDGNYMCTSATVQFL